MSRGRRPIAQRASEAHADLCAIAGHGDALTKQVKQPRQHMTEVRSSCGAQQR
jgi:hypothetical protein